TYALSPPPANDSFATASAFGPFPAHLTLSTGGATLEAGEPNAVVSGGSYSCGPSNGSLVKSVWFTYTPGSAGTLTLSTAGSDFDTTIVVYTGSSLGGLTRTGCSDDTNAPYVLQSQVSLNVSA